MEDGEQPPVSVYQAHLMPGINEMERGGIKIGKLILLYFTYSALFRSKYPKTVYLRFQSHPESEMFPHIPQRRLDFTMYWKTSRHDAHPGMPDQTLTSP